MSAFVGIQVRTSNDAGGNPRVGWRVFQLSDRGDESQQVTPLGFVEHDEGNGWAELRRHLPGITYVTDLNVSAEDFERYRREVVKPAHMRRVADAVDGN